tara:strand:- start:180169 stop:180675 length:507 start_codon:yes stop_codon:yes gene_type:complete
MFYKNHFRVSIFASLYIASMVIFLALASPHQALAQTPAQASEESVTFARLISTHCLGRWAEQDCLTSVSQSTLVLAANYAGFLESNGMIGAVEQIKQHCSAATAGTKGEYPAYAMQSAFTECANMIFDVSEQTNIKPDLSHYQILVSAILCLSKDRRCAGIEKQLKGQ